MELREVMYVDHIDRTFPFFLSADIGGTNSNFGIFSLNPEKAVLVLSLHYKSKNIEDFTEFMKSIIDYIRDQFAISVKAVCLGAAGIVYPHRVSARPTNLSIEININLVSKVTGINDIILINDFEAVALGIDLLDPRSIVNINKDGVHRRHANSACIGAGTGLGKSILVWHRDENRYLPIPSEGGHADAVFTTQEEFELRQFIHDEYVKCPISWEMVLSGAGIQRIYRFLGTKNLYAETEVSHEIEKSGFNPDRISFFAEQDERCKDTFDLYCTFYARACKNFALESLSLNGIYIAGGIAAKNIRLFVEPLFLQEFKKCGKQRSYLEKIPVYLIIDYNVSLYGALAAYYLHRGGDL